MISRCLWMVALVLALCLLAGLPPAAQALIVRDNGAGRAVTGWVAVPLGSTTWGVFNEGGRLVAFGFLTKAGAEAWIAANETAGKVAGP